MQIKGHIVNLYSIILVKYRFIIKENIYKLYEHSCKRLPKLFLFSSQTLHNLIKFL